MKHVPGSRGRREVYFAVTLLSVPLDLQNQRIIKHYKRLNIISSNYIILYNVYYVKYIKMFLFRIINCLPLNVLLYNF